MLSTQTAHRARRHECRSRLAAALASTLTLAAILALTLLPAPAVAVTGVTQPDRDCTAGPPETAYVRAELVDRTGRASGAFVDSRCTGRTLQASLHSRYRYLIHRGLTAPGSVITITYTRADDGQQVRTETVTADRTGTFQTKPTNLRCLATRGDILTVDVRHHDPGPTIQQGLVEYGLILGLIA